MSPGRRVNKIQKQLEYYSLSDPDSCLWTRPLHRTLSSEMSPHPLSSTPKLHSLRVSEHRSHSLPDMADKTSRFRKIRPAHSHTVRAHTFRPAPFQNIRHRAVPLAHHAADIRTTHRTFHMAMRLFLAAHQPLDVAVLFYAIVSLTICGVW